MSNHEDCANKAFILVSVIQLSNIAFTRLLAEEILSRWPLSLGNAPSDANALLELYKGIVDKHVYDDKPHVNTKRVAAIRPHGTCSTKAISINDDDDDDKDKSKSKKSTDKNSRSVNEKSRSLNDSDDDDDIPLVKRTLHALCAATPNKTITTNNNTPLKTISSSRKHRSTTDYDAMYTPSFDNTVDKDDDYESEDVDEIDQRLDARYESSYPVVGVGSPCKRQKKR